MRGYSPADSADYAEECSKLYYPAEKDRLFEVVAVVAVLLFWGFVCVNLRDLREIYGVSFVLIDRVLLCVILPQISQMTQRNTAELYYFAEKDRLFEVVAVVAVLQFWGFGVLSAIICVICERYIGFHLC